MSSLRNSLHRRNHKERSQPTHRARLGLLEKHKDYVLRARDYHSKQERIALLRERAALRNKDEFYFGMARERTVGGVHVKDRGNVSLPVDVVKLLKSQDEGYLRTMRTAGLKKIDRLKSQLSQLADLLRPLTAGDDDESGGLEEEELEVLREAGVIPPQSGSGSRRRRRSSSRKGKHILFAEDEAEAQELASASRKPKAKSTDEEAMDIEPKASFGVDLGWKSPVESQKKKGRKPKGGPVGEGNADEVLAPESLAAGKENRSRLLKELSARLIRDRHLRYAEREMEMQRLLMGKGGTRKVSGVERVDDEGGDDADEDEDEAPKSKKVDEKTWKPRVYKWRIERKR